MRLLIIHAKTGDTVAAVVRTEKLDMMGVKYTEIFPNHQLSELLEKNTDLYEDVSLLMDTYLNKIEVGMASVVANELQFDYRLLLFKYINHIREQEGFTYIVGRSGRCYLDKKIFSKEEIEELIKLNEEQYGL